MNGLDATDRPISQVTTMRLIGIMAILLALVVSVWQGSATAQRQPGSTDTSQGTPPRAIAHGVAAMPSDSIAWRLVEDTAKPADRADFHQYAVGFTLATDGDVQIQDGATGNRDLIGPDEAAFVADGASELRASTTDSDTPYVRFALVYANARRDAQGGTLVGNTDAFDAPSQPNGTDAFQLALYGGSLNQNQATTFDTGDQPALLYVTNGTLQISNAEQPLNAGDALPVSGNVTLTGTEDGTRYAMASIGKAVQSLPTPAPTAKSTAKPTESPSRSASPSPSASREPTGNAIIRTYLCPDQPYWAIDLDSCESAKNTNWTAQAATYDFSTTLDLSDATIDRNAAFWTLPKSDQPYAFNVTPPDGYGHVEPVNNAGDRSTLASPDANGVASVNFYFFPYGERLGNAGGFGWNAVTDSGGIPQQFETPVVYDGNDNQVLGPVPVYQGAAGPNFNDLPFGAYTIDISASLDGGSLTATADNATATDTPGVFTIDIEDTSHPTVTFTIKEPRSSPSPSASESARPTRRGSVGNRDNVLTVRATEPCPDSETPDCRQPGGSPVVTDENGDPLRPDSGNDPQGRDLYSNVPDGTYTIDISGTGDGFPLDAVSGADATDDPNVYTVTVSGGEQADVVVTYTLQAG